VNKQKTPRPVSFRSNLLHLFIKLATTKKSEREQTNAKVALEVSLYNLVLADNFAGCDTVDSLYTRPVVPKAACAPVGLEMMSPWEVGKLHFVGDVERRPWAR
jgi:hypothetical protein